jgi:hypothetical protein
VALIGGFSFAWAAAKETADYGSGTRSISAAMTLSDVMPSASAS